MRLYGFPKFVFYDRKEEIFSRDCKGGKDVFGDEMGDFFFS
jgi:hypothetical protein